MAYGVILGQSFENSPVFNDYYTKQQTLSASTASMFGFGASAVPNDMFNVLTHAGDLHVWRRTVSSSDGKPEVPGSYELGQTQIGKFQFSSNLQGNNVSYLYSDSVDVSIDGKLSMPSSSKTYSVNSGGNASDANVFLGKFIQFNSTSHQFDSVFSTREILYIPENATFTKDFFTYYVNMYQEVTGISGSPAVPPSTVTVDYPVSPNRNAYQEGSDGQPAGYTLGEVQSGSFRITPRSNTAIWRYNDAITVSDDGNISLGAYKSSALDYGTSLTTVESYFKGKFCALVSGTGIDALPFVKDIIYYFPEDSVFNVTDGSWFVDKYQTVTGYPSIPAGTIIEYMGQVGDKVRIVTGSYVGTGTFGQSNPNSLTFPFPPSVVIVWGLNRIMGAGTTTSSASFVGFVSDVDTPFGYYEIVSFDSNALSWYSTVSANSQFNVSGETYNYVAFS